MSNFSIVFEIDFVTSHGFVIAITVPFDLFSTLVNDKHQMEHRT